MTFSWPTNFRPETAAWQIQKSVAGFRSPMGGSYESIEYPGQYWKVSATFPPRMMRDAGAITAFFMRLAGGSETVYVPSWPRLIRQGTISGAPVVQVQAQRGDLQIQIWTDGTLAAGDMFSILGQTFITLSDCVPIANILSVPLVNRVRRTLAPGSAVIWDIPMTKCVLPSNSFGASYLTNIMSGLPVDLEEAP